MLCARCKKFLIFLFKHLTKRASSAQTPRAQVLIRKKNSREKKKMENENPPFFFWSETHNFGLEKYHTHKTTYDAICLTSTALFLTPLVLSPLCHHRFSAAIFILLVVLACWDVGRFIFLLMKQLLPGGIMTIIIIIMRHAKVAVKASCKIIFRWQLSEAAFHFEPAKPSQPSRLPAFPAKKPLAWLN